MARRKQRGRPTKGLAAPLTLRLSQSVDRWLRTQSLKENVSMKEIVEKALKLMSSDQIAKPFAKEIA